MIQYTKLSITVLLSSLLVACQSSADGKVTLRWSVDQENLGNGKVVISAVLENNSDSTLRFLRWYTPFEASVLGSNYTVYQQQQNRLLELDYIGILVKRGQPLNSDFISVFSGQKIENRQDITNNYNFCRGLDYKIELAGFKSALDSELLLKPAALEFKASKPFPECR